mmetsp:Transcript_110132/g.350935  ORF Transcript_110132/g.350935 Transcript_110132/m.350935 type:complete len:284 (-) Transcript_110132:1616-2467(-)
MRRTGGRRKIRSGGRGSGSTTFVASGLVRCQLPFAGCRPCRAKPQTNLPAPRSTCKYSPGPSLEGHQPPKAQTGTPSRSRQLGAASWFELAVSAESGKSPQAKPKGLPKAAATSAPRRPWLPLGVGAYCVELEEPPISRDAVISSVSLPKDEQKLSKPFTPSAVKLHSILWSSAIFRQAVARWLSSCRSIRERTFKDSSVFDASFLSSSFSSSLDSTYSMSTPFSIRRTSGVNTATAFSRSRSCLSKTESSFSTEAVLRSACDSNMRFAALPSSTSRPSLTRC